ncbi:hypothetical protein CVT25_005543 [Psilocybe cyanescens]|uniref:Uncharacterized protein n=1 Tax=Psilocybe cyanescens TaxID=93625 RepID=A0A409VQX7_PSICY|nr:hypothetical protein CVT25_005543 [Psilocybe cyanescens]
MYVVYTPFSRNNKQTTPLATLNEYRKGRTTGGVEQSGNKLNPNNTFEKKDDEEKKRKGRSEKEDEDEDEHMVHTRGGRREEEEGVVKVGGDEK